MTYLISGILIITNYFSSIFKNKKYLLGSMLIVFMWLLFWGSYQNADYSNYVLHYNQVILTGNDFSSGQFGFTVLMKIAIFFKMEYYQFLIILSTLGLVMITTTINKYTDKPEFVYVLYFFYPFLLDIVQIKHFMAMCFVVFALRYLIKDRFVDIVKFIVLIFIATSIHYIALIFLPLVIVNHIRIKHLYRLMFFYLLLFVPLAYTSFFRNIANSVFSSQGLDTFFTNRARWGFLLQFAIQFTILLMILFSKKFLEKSSGENLFATMVYKANVYMLVLFPLYIINGSFERAFRMLLIPNYIVFSMLFMKIQRNERVRFLVAMLCIIIAMFLFYIFRSVRDTVVFPVFENNLVFQT